MKISLICALRNEKKVYFYSMKETNCFGQPKKTKKMELITSNSKFNHTRTDHANARNFVLDTINAMQRFQSMHNDGQTQCSLDETINELFGIFDGVQFNFKTWCDDLMTIKTSSKFHDHVVDLNARMNEIRSKVVFNNVKNR